MVKGRKYANREQEGSGENVLQDLTKSVFSAPQNTLSLEAMMRD